jgi:integral membrane protein
LKRIYSIVAWFEAFTWAGLLMGMCFKYGEPGVDTGVWLFGRLHGAAFLMYGAVAILAAARFRWPWWASLLALFAAIPPLATLPAEALLRRRGLLDAPAAE